MMGAYLSNVASHDVSGSAREKVRPVGEHRCSRVFQTRTSVILSVRSLLQICQFFRSGQFKSALSVDTKLKPSLARKLLQRFDECFAGDEYSRNVDKCVFRK